MGVILLDCNFRNCKSNGDRIKKIDALIDELLNGAAASIAAGNIAEYDLDTGQTKTRLKYTSMESVTSTIESYERLRQVYVNRLQGRTMRLVDESNFKK